MNNKKVIERVANIYRLQSIGAGVYNLTGNLTVVPRFNLMVAFFGGSALFYDNVTNQSVNGAFSLELNVALGADNPGIGINAPALLELPVFYGSTRTGFTGIETFSFLSAEDPVRIDFTVNLETVTANQINCRFAVYLKYVCPEDYLAVDAFLIDPR